MLKMMMMKTCRTRCGPYIQCKVSGVVEENVLECLRIIHHITRWAFFSWFHLQMRKLVDTSGRRNKKPKSVSYAVDDVGSGESEDEDENNYIKNNSKKSKFLINDHQVSLQLCLVVLFCAFIRNDIFHSYPSPCVGLTKHVYFRFHIILRS